MFDAKDAKQQVEKFMRALFDDSPGVVCAWRKSDKRSFWGSWKDVLKQVVGGVDFYVCACCAEKPTDAHHKLTNDTAASMSAIWVDIDIADGIHAKPNLPATLDDAFSLLDMLPLKPSIVILTGGGIHVWWLLSETFVFETDDDRLKAGYMVERWQAFIRGKARERNWTIDATHDLARLMRIPGTFNGKTTPNKPVTIERIDNKLRFEISDFEQWIGPLKAERKRAAPIESVGDIIINPDAAPSPKKMKVMSDNHEKFDSTYDRTRRDLEDRSPSGYDMSLAVMAAQAKWTTQEIVDLIVASRIKAGQPIHEDRPDKYKMTIAKAVQWTRRTDAETTIETALIEGTSKDIDKRPELIQAIRDQIGGVPIEKVTKYMSDPPTYSLITTAGEIHLGTVDNLISQRPFRSAIAAVEGILIPSIKAKAWESFAQMLLDVCEHVTIGDEATDRGQASVWIEDYLHDFKPLEDQAEAEMFKRPFIKDGVIHFSGQSLRDWLRSKGENVTAKRLGMMLRSVGCMPIVVGRTTGGTQRAWSISDKFSLYKGGKSGVDVSKKVHVKDVNGVK